MLTAMLYLWTLPLYKLRCMEDNVCWVCGTPLVRRWRFAGWTGWPYRARYCPNWRCGVGRVI